MTERGGVSEALVVVILAIALFVIFFGAFLVVPLIVVIVGLAALAVGLRSRSRGRTEVKPRSEAKLPEIPGSSAERDSTTDKSDSLG